MRLHDKISLLPELDKEIISRIVKIKNDSCNELMNFYMSYELLLKEIADCDNFINEEYESQIHILKFLSYSYIDIHFHNCINFLLQEDIKKSCENFIKSLSNIIFYANYINEKCHLLNYEHDDNEFKAIVDGFKNIITNLSPILVHDADNQSIENNIKQLNIEIINYLSFANEYNILLLKNDYEKNIYFLVQKYFRIFDFDDTLKLFQNNS